PRIPGPFRADASRGRRGPDVRPGLGQCDACHPSVRARRLSSTPRAFVAKDCGAGSKRVFVEPATDTERRLARLWMDGLRLDRVSTRDSFFDLGGHSLLAARLFAKFQNDFGVTLPLAVL